MKGIEPSSKSIHSIYYWLIWGIEIIVLIFIKLYYSGYHMRVPNSVLDTYIIATWIFMGIINLYEQVKLSKYMRKFHYDKMKEITYGPFNYELNIKLSFMISSEDFGDNRLKNIKWNCRSTLILTLTVFFSFIFIFLIFG